MTLAARKHRAALLREVEMSGLQEVGAGQPKIARLADDLLSRKSLVFAHPGDVLSDQELSLTDKRSLLASWVSDAFAVENSPSLRQLTSGAVVRVDDIMDALKSLDEPRREAGVTISQSFARRGGKPVARRRNRGRGADDEPPPPAVGARIPSAWKVLIGARQDSTSPTLATGYLREISVGGRSAA
jgi:hypothetical protein